jgi:hypothetical protein
VAEAIVLLHVALICAAILLYRARRRAAERRRWWPGDAEGAREFRDTPRSSVPMVPSVVLRSVAAPARSTVLDSPPAARAPRVEATAGSKTMAAAIRGRGNAVAASRFVESQSARVPHPRAAHR